MALPVHSSWQFVSVLSVQGVQGAREVCLHVCMAAPERLLTYQRTPTLTSSFSLTLTQTLTPTPTRNVASMAVAPDGTAMATSGYDGLVKIWVGSA